MSLRTNHHGTDYEIVLSGRLDGEAANNLEIAILAMIQEGAQTVAVNMAAVNFLCSAGIRVLLQYARQMRAAGKSLVVSSPSPEVNSVLQSTGFAELILEANQKR